jgi:predicted oxidoreductase
MTTPTPALTLSPVVAGCWRLAEWGWSAEDTLRWIEQAVERGVTSFDHADIYGGYRCEALFGAALALAPALRPQLQLVSKCGIQLVTPARPQHRLKAYDTSAAHITVSVENSLRELRTDHLDLLLIHRPDALLDAAEVAATFERLRAAGKVRAFGVSNFTPRQFELLDAALPMGHKLVTNQIELHPLHRAPLHDGTLDQLQQRGTPPMIWSPLAGGRLLHGEGDDARRVQAVLQRLAHEHGVSPASIAYAWLRRHPTRPVLITGSRRIEALDEAVAALRIELDRASWYEVWQAGAGQEVA